MFRVDYNLGFTLTRVSRNAKTGPIPVTTSPQQTCPDVCPLKRAGCYADAGPLRRIWDRLSSTSAGGTFPNGPKGSVRVLYLHELAAAIRTFGRVLWRHNQAGDLAHHKGRIDNASLAAIARANYDADAMGFTYTHHNVLGNSDAAAHNRGAISAANDMGFTINLSANNPHHADKLADLDIAPVVTLLPEGQTDDTCTPKGRTIKVCPALKFEHVTCQSCGMCQDQSRAFLIGFNVHGNSKAKAGRLVA